MNNIYLLRRPLQVGILGFLLSLAGLTRLVAQDDVPTAPMSLDACIEYALAHQKTIQNAVFDKYIAEKQVQEFKGVGLPQVSGNASFQQFGQFPTSIIDIGNFNFDPSAGPLPAGIPDSIRYQAAQFGVKYNGSIGAQVTQLLFDGSFFVGVQAAKAYVQLTEINVRRSQEEVAIKVTQAYYSALLSEERARVLTTNVSRLEKLLETTEALYKEGFTEKVDADRLRITLNNLRAEERKVGRMIDLSFDLLKFQMGMPVNSEIRLSEKIADVDQVPPIASLVMDGNFAENRTEMQVLRQSVTLNSLNTKRLQVGRYGSLVASANFNYQTFRPRFFAIDLPQKWFPASFWGISYQITLFDGLRSQANTAKSRFEVSKLNNQIEMFEQGVELEARAAATNVTNSWADVENARENKALADEVYRIATTKYKEGVGSNLEVIDAENTLMESQVNYLSALYSYVIATVELRRVKGEFTQYIPVPTEE
jgi:outer membrane protein